MVDTIMVSEVVGFAQYDQQLAYQRIDPWIRNAAQKLRKGTFKRELLSSSIAKISSARSNRSIFQSKRSLQRY